MLWMVGVLMLHRMCGRGLSPPVPPSDAESFDHDRFGFPAVALLRDCRRRGHTPGRLWRVGHVIDFIVPVDFADEVFGKTNVEALTEAKNGFKQNRGVVPRVSSVFRRNKLMSQQGRSRLNVFVAAGGGPVQRNGSEKRAGFTSQELGRRGLGNLL